ncbi:MAG: CoA-binding protein, partial [bacterium]
MFESLFYPKVVAVIGASRTPGKLGHQVLLNLVECGFKEVIIPVNPNANEILNLKCYANLKSHSGKINHSVIVVPVSKVKDAVLDSISAGAGTITIITAGFKESGPEGAELETEITRICLFAGVRLLGPNSLGFMNTDNGFNASASRSRPLAGGISIMSQSGALCTAILDWASERRIGIAKFASLGNKADLNEIDFLTALAADEETKVIGGYLETI